MNEPVDEPLYAQTKKMVDKMYDRPSAYRSMAYSRFYMRAFREKYGDKRPYKGGNQPGELEKWRREKWIDVRSYLETPEKPRACGSVDSKEYAFCMPQSNLKKYSHTELVALLNRKEAIESKRLVKEPFLRDLGVTKHNRTRKAIKRPFKRETRVEPPKPQKREERVKIPKTITKELEAEPEIPKPSKEFHAGKISFD